MQTSAKRDVDVLVIGEALMDVVRLGGAEVEHVGGSPANVALGLGRLGRSAALLTRLGRDGRGQVIAAHLAESGVDVLPESYSADRTSTAIATIGADGQASYDFDVVWDLPAAAPQVMPRVVHTGSIAAFLAPGAARVREIASGVGAVETTFDPNIRVAFLDDREAALRAYDDMLRLATVVKMSDEDADWLYPGASADEVLDRVLDSGPRLAAITRGGDGSLVATADERVRVPVQRVDVSDTIGAGDTFMTSLIDSVLTTGSAGLDRAALEGMGARAARAAALTVSRPGADLPWAREL